MSLSFMQFSQSQRKQSHFLFTLKFTQGSEAKNNKMKSKFLFSSIILHLSLEAKHLVKCFFLNKKAQSGNKKKCFYDVKKKKKEKAKGKDRRSENEKASLLNSLNGKYFSCLFDFSSSSCLFILIIRRH